MMLERALNSRKSDYRLERLGRLEVLQQRINDEDYLYAAIQRLALVLSNELMEIPKEGGRYERRQKRYK